MGTLRRFISKVPRWVWLVLILAIGVVACTTETLQKPKRGEEKVHPPVLTVAPDVLLMCSDPALIPAGCADLDSALKTMGLSISYPPMGKFELLTPLSETADSIAIADFRLVLEAVLTQRAKEWKMTGIRYIPLCVENKKYPCATGRDVPGDELERSLRKKGLESPGFELFWAYPGARPSSRSESYGDWGATMTVDDIVYGADGLVRVRLGSTSDAIRYWNYTLRREKTGYVIVPN